MADAPKIAARGKTRKARVIKEPTNDVERMKYFYQKRAKDPIHYTYTPEGDLRIQGLKNVPDSTIPLRYFSALEPEERKEIENKRLSNILESETAYEQSLLALRDAVAKFREGGQLDEDAIAVVRANEEVRLNSLLRSEDTYPTKWIKDIDNPSVSDILLTQRYETRKMGYDIFLFKRLDMSKKNAWGHYRPRPVSGEGVAQSGGSSEVIFITDAEDKETGHFHPAAIHEFVFEETRYVSPYQAYEGERFRELDNEPVRKQILGTRSARTIQNIAVKEEKQVEDPVKLWEDILDALYSQNTELANKLKATGSSKFHLMDKEMGGQLFVDALEKTRTRLREEAEENQKAPQEVKESAITEEEQKKAKKAAIINNFRRR